MPSRSRQWRRRRQLPRESESRAIKSIYGNAEPKPTMTPLSVATVAREREQSHKIHLWLCRAEADNDAEGDNCRARAEPLFHETKEENKSTCLTSPYHLPIIKLSSSYHLTPPLKRRGGRGGWGFSFFGVYGASLASWWLPNWGFSWKLTS